jgi:hypothetical protein
MAQAHLDNARTYPCRVTDGVHGACVSSQWPHTGPISASLLTSVSRRAPFHSGVTSLGQSNTCHVIGRLQRVVPVDRYGRRNHGYRFTPTTRDTFCFDASVCPCHRSLLLFPNAGDAGTETTKQSHVPGFAFLGGGVLLCATCRTSREPGWLPSAIERVGYASAALVNRRHCLHTYILHLYQTEKPVRLFLAVRVARRRRRS